MKKYLIVTLVFIIIFTSAPIVSKASIVSDGVSVSISEETNTSWTCPNCGEAASGNFCSNCGTARPQTDEWICPTCGETVKGNFCNNCGTARPDVISNSIDLIQEQDEKEKEKGSRSNPYQIGDTIIIDKAYSVININAVFSAEIVVNDSFSQAEGAQVLKDHDMSGWNVLPAANISLKLEGDYDDAIQYLDWPVKIDILTADMQSNNYMPWTSEFRDIFELYTGIDYEFYYQINIDSETEPKYLRIQYYDSENGTVLKSIYVDLDKTTDSTVEEDTSEQEAEESQGSRNNPYILGSDLVLEFDTYRYGEGTKWRLSNFETYRKKATNGEADILNLQFDCELLEASDESQAYSVDNYIDIRQVDSSFNELSGYTIYKLDGEKVDSNAKQFTGSMMKATIAPYMQGLYNLDEAPVIEYYTLYYYKNETTLSDAIWLKYTPDADIKVIEKEIFEEETESIVISEEELQAELSQQEVRVISTDYIVQSEDYKILYPDILSARIKNDTNYNIKNLQVALVAWDKNKLPVKIKAAHTVRDGSYTFLVNYEGINLVPGDIAGDNSGLEIDDDCNITYFEAVIYSYETYDGTIWENPLFSQWEALYSGNPMPEEDSILDDSVYETEVSENDELLLNSLLEKEYEPLSSPDNNNYKQFIIDLISNEDDPEEFSYYSVFVDPYNTFYDSPYYEDDKTYLSNPKYEYYFENMYKWAYEISNYDRTLIPKEARGVWDELVEFAVYIRDSFSQLAGMSSDNRSNVINDYLNSYIDKYNTLIDDAYALFDGVVKNGETFSLGEYEITVKSYKFTSEFSVPYPKATYRLKDNKNIFIDVIADVKNCGKKYNYTEFDVKAIYSDGYEYNLYTAGNDLIDPLETKTINFYQEVPKEISNSSEPLYIMFKLGDRLYKYIIREEIIENPQENVTFFEETNSSSNNDIPENQDTFITQEVNDAALNAQNQDETETVFETQNELQNALDNQKVKVISVNSEHSGVKFLSADVQNNLEKSVHNVKVAWVAWDEFGNPVRYSLNKKNDSIISGLEEYYIAYSSNSKDYIENGRCGTFISIVGDRITQFPDVNITNTRAIVYYYETEDGEKWRNPLFDQWKQLYVNKPLDDTSTPDDNGVTTQEQFDTAIIDNQQEETHVLSEITENDNKPSNQMELQEMLDEQDLHIISTDRIPSDSEIILATVENSTDKKIENIQVAYAAWDYRGIPIKGDSYLWYSTNELVDEMQYIHVADESENVFQNASYIKAIVYEYQTEDGTIWNNPLFGQWEAMYSGKLLKSTLSENKVDVISEIKRLQEALIAFGYDCGIPDGIFGQYTKNAMKAFQEASGLPITEEITQELWLALGLDSNLDSSFTIDENGYQLVSVGDYIETDFILMSFDSYGSEEIIDKPNIWDKGLYLPDVEDEEYVFLSGTMKNLSSRQYDLQYRMQTEFYFDESHKYQGNIKAYALNRDRDPGLVQPYVEYSYYIYVSIPSDVLEEFDSCTITIGFADDFEYLRTAGEELKYKYLLSAGTSEITENYSGKIKLEENNMFVVGDSEYPTCIFEDIDFGISVLPSYTNCYDVYPHRYLIDENNKIYITFHVFLKNCSDKQLYVDDSVINIKAYDENWDEYSFIPVGWLGNNLYADGEEYSYDFLCKVSKEFENSGRMFTFIITRGDIIYILQSVPRKGIYDSTGF